jgi:hypothetical protein
MPFVDAKETPETKVSLTNSIRGNKLYCAQAEIARKATAGVAIASLVSREARLVLGPAMIPKGSCGRNALSWVSSRLSRPKSQSNGTARGRAFFRSQASVTASRMLSMMDRKPRAPVLRSIALPAMAPSAGEAEVDAFHLEQPLVLLDQGILGLKAP